MGTTGPAIVDGGDLTLGSQNIAWTRVDTISRSVDLHAT
jgi:hypothetical protein